MALDGEARVRRRASSFLDKLSTLRTRSRSSSSSSSLRSFSEASRPPTPAGFTHFTRLPFELQAYTLTFLPSKVLHRTIGRTNRHYRTLVESHTRRRVLAMMALAAQTPDGPSGEERIADNVLVFEAQRPIDTLTTRHTLYFSHFTTTALDMAGSTLAHFSFAPVEQDVKRSESVDSTTTSSSDRTASASSPRLAATAPQSPLAGTLGQRHFPIVHADDRSRLRPTTVTSSVGASAQPDGRLPPSSPSTRRRPFTDVSVPIEWRETTVNATRLLSDDDDEHARRLRPPPSRTAARGRGYEGFEASEPQLQGHWSEPVASSAAAFDGDGDEARRARRHRKPTYRFQLDPLDSFETWILSLTLQRKSGPGWLWGKSTGRSMRWEKRVAEGLDRVFRQWFHGGEEGGLTADSALHRVSLIASMGSGHRQSHLGQPGEEEESDEAGEAARKMTMPPPQMLEFDGTSCTMLIQPHPIAPSSHPALTSMSSHLYLSSSSLSSHASLTSRVEFTFHCESLSINAARLLCALEEVERDVEQASDQARLRGAHVVSGSSGGTAWAYSTGGSSYTASEASTSRWTSDRADGGVAVVVFGAARA